MQKRAGGEEVIVTGLSSPVRFVGCLWMWEMAWAINTKVGRGMVRGRFSVTIRSKVRMGMRREFACQYDCTLYSLVFALWSSWITQELHRSCERCLLSVFSARCNIYISRLCYDISVCLSVMEVYWRIIANLGFIFGSKFTAHCGRSPSVSARMHWSRSTCGRAHSQCMRVHTASCSACGRIVVAVHAGKMGGVI